MPPNGQMQDQRMQQMMRMQHMQQLMQKMGGAGGGIGGLYQNMGMQQQPQFDPMRGQAGLNPAYQNQMQQRGGFGGYGGMGGMQGIAGLRSMYGGGFAEGGLVTAPAAAPVAWGAAPAAAPRISWNAVHPAATSGVSLPVIAQPVQSARFEPRFTPVAPVAAVAPAAPKVNPMAAKLAAQQDAAVRIMRAGSTAGHFSSWGTNPRWIATGGHNAR
jgi:hypothetical protein